MNKTPSTSDIIYTAGLFDGEGSISLLSEHGRSLGLNVVLGMTEFHIVDWLHETYGGAVGKVEKPKGLGTKPFKRWYIRGDEAVWFLGLIRPYLRIKCFTAWLASEGWANRYAVKGREPLNEETRALRLGFYLAMRYANGRVPQEESRVALHESKWSRESRPCTECGTLVTRSPSRFKKSGTVTCSTKCLRRLQLRNLSRRSE